MIAIATPAVLSLLGTAIVTDVFGLLTSYGKELAELKEIEEKKFKTAFSSWYLKLSNSDKETILLKYPKIEEGSKLSEMAKLGNLKKYFKEEVYSKNYMEIKLKFSLQ